MNSLKNTNASLTNDFDWDDLRFIVAVVDSGSALAAAEALGVNATTVQRRISRFEQQNGLRLFERRQTGMTPTPECDFLVEASRDVQDRVASLRRDILGRDLRLEGRLAFTTVDTLMYTSLARHLTAFQLEFPKIQLDVTLTNDKLNLSRQDADVAIRPSNTPSENLVGQRVAKLAFAIYANQNFAKTLPENAQLDQLQKAPWIGTGRALRGSAAANWISDNIPHSAINIRIDTFMGISTAIAAAPLIGMLPCAIADQNPQCVRIAPPKKELDTDIWVLTHPEIRHAAKIKAFSSFISKAIRGSADEFAGKT